MEDQKEILIGFLGWLEKQPIHTMSSENENIVNEFIKMKVCPNCGKLENEKYSPCCSLGCWSVIYED